jgi:very-short-patch-repair endonuclease
MRYSRLVPYRLQLKGRSRSLRRDPTPAERKLWFEFLKCSSRRLVIAIDGDSHFNARGESYDMAGTEALARLGLRVIRFTNLEVMQQFDAVCARIEEALQAQS